MRVLITNRGLVRRAGTELFVRDLAFALKARGLEPVCFAPETGEVAEEIRAGGIEVEEDLDRLDPPDLIHAQHHPAAAAAFSAFPDTPAIYVCHGVKPWPEAPLARFPNIRAYVAVDQACADFLVEGHAIPPRLISVIRNGVDMARFPDAPDAPDRRKRALLISNIAEEASLAPFRQACARAGYELDAAGSGLGAILDKPETVLPRYGLVFAKARAALEAMACGCAVQLADYGRIGPLVTTQNFDHLRDWNFGFRVIEDAPESGKIRRAVEAVDWADVAAVSARVREEAGFDTVAGQFELVYRAARNRPPANPGDPADAMRDYMLSLLPHLQERDDLAGKLYRTVKDGIARDRALSALLIRAVQGEIDGRALAREAVRLDPENSAAAALLKAMKTDRPAP